MTAQLSRERLEALANLQSLECMALPASHAESAEMARVLLAGMGTAVAGFDAATAIRACMEEFPEHVHDIVEECAQIAENTISTRHSAPPAPVMPGELHPDTQKLVADFCAALAEKLYKAQLKYGYDADWKQDGWPSQCQAHFHQHIAKGDPRDVAAYCAFMWYHGWKTKPAPVADQTAAKEKLLELIERGIDFQSVGGEPAPVAYPAPKDAAPGWKIDPDFINKVQELIGYDEECECWEGTPSMEMVEAVLLAASKLIPTPAPVAVPDCFRNAVSALESLYRNGQKQCWNERYTTDMSYASGVLNACRAAMLKAGPVTAACNLPANTPCKDAPEHIWLQTAGIWPENGEFSELTWCSDNQHQDDTLYVRADIVSGNSPVIPDCSCRTCRPVTTTDMRFVVCPDCGNKRCPHANDHRNACSGSNEPGQVGSAYPAAPEQEV